MEIAINTEEMIYMIEVFMGLEKNSTYEMESVASKMTLKFTGDFYKVQSEVLKWLTIPDRLHNIKYMEEFREGKLVIKNS